MLLMIDGQNAAPASYAGIDDHNMDRPFGEILIIRRYQISGLMNILRCDPVGDIDDRHRGIDRQHHAFHNPDVFVIGAKIR